MQLQPGQVAGEELQQDAEEQVVQRRLRVQVPDALEQPVAKQVDVDEVQRHLQQ